MPNVRATSRRSLIVAVLLGVLVALLPVTSAQAAATVPGAPASFQLRAPINGGQNFFITAPADNGGSAVTGYTVYATSSFDGIEVARVAVFNGGLWVISGLRGATEYTYRIAAVNAVGEGPKTALALKGTTSRTVPDAPVVSPAVLGERSATVTFKVPYSGGNGLDLYRWRINGLTWWEFTGSFTEGDTVTVPLPATLDTVGLHTLEVQAHALGLNWGASGVTSFTPVGKPYALTNLTATPLDAGADLQFSAVSGSIPLGGTALLGYEYSVDDGATWAPVTIAARAWTGILNGSGGVITGLTNGETYTVLLRSYNAQGRSPSTSVTVTPRTTPGAPAGLDVGPGDRSLSGFFEPPSVTGGAPVTAYRYRVNGGSWVTVPQPGDLAFDVTGLVNGAPYTLGVQAFNVAGWGGIAEITGKPSALPPPVYNLTAEPGDGKASFRFSGPRVSRLQPILRYEASVDGGAWKTVSTVSPAWTGIFNPQVGEVTGLQNGKTQTLRFRSVNDKGASDPVAIDVIPRTVPGAPADLTAGPGNGSATVSFDKPTDNGGDPVDGYQYRLGGGPWVTLPTTPADFDLTGLTNGFSYVVQVRAHNAAGYGDPASVTVVPNALPPAVSSLTAVSGDRQGVLTFSSPRVSALTPILSYEYSLDSVHWSTLETTSPAFTGLVNPRRGTVSGLTNGGSYDVQVRAVNLTGAGEPASVHVAPVAVPGMVTNMAATPGNGSATVTFGVPESDGGSSITRYEYAVGNGAWLKTGNDGADRVIDLSALTNGVAYAVKVRAVNAVGAGAPASTTVTPNATVPTVAPGDPKLKLVNGGAVLTFDPPAAGGDGGSGITEYEVVATPKGGGDPVKETCKTSPCEITGLVNGKEYGFGVAAVNDKGTGPFADAGSGTPNPTPPTGKPTAPELKVGNGSALLTFVPPTGGGTGGSSLTGFVVRVTDEDGNTRDVNCLFSPCEITNLQNGKKYDFEIAAVNEKGTGPFADAGSGTPNPVAPTGKPSAPELKVGNGSALLTFVPPTGGGTGGSDITGFIVKVTDSDGVSKDVPCVSSPCEITGLVNGKKYDFGVAAVNERGTGPFADAGSGTPAPTKPTQAPGSLEVDSVDYRSVTLSFTEPSGDGGAAITGFVLEATPSGGGASKSTECQVSPCTVPDLEAGRAYDFTVAAVNGKGTGPASDPVSATTKQFTAPTEAPSGLQAAPGNGKATLTFTPPSTGGNGGLPITGYMVIVSGSGLPDFRPCPQSGCEITGLQNGTPYTFVVAAMNQAGTGPAGAPAAATPLAPITAPTAKPTAPELKVGNGSALLTFVAPTGGGTGGSDITGFIVRVTGPDGVSRDVECKASPCEITGLENGKKYGFEVAAVNDQGTGPFADAGQGMPNPTKPTERPTDVEVKVGNRSAIVTFTPPSSGGDGGSAIKGFVVKVTGPGGAALFTVDCKVSPCEVTELENGKTYDFQVAAYNDQGTGPFAPAGSGTPNPTPPTGVPSAPELKVGNGSALLTFVPPTGGGTGGSNLTGYIVKVTGPDGVSKDVECQSSPCEITGLENGKKYDFEIAAVNEKGTGPFAPAGSGTPNPTPPTGTPGEVKLETGNGNAKLTFTEPTGEGTGGSSITGYRVKVTPEGGTPYFVDCNVSPCEIPHLENGKKYAFEVAAVNDQGTGPFADAGEGTPIAPTPTATAPGKVTQVAKTVGDGVAKVSFEPPSDDGGSPVTGYEYKVGDGAWTPTGINGEDLFVELKGLTNGTAYVVSVRALNKAGNGEPDSVTVTPVAPPAPAATKPGAPRNVTAVVKGTTAEVSWQAPASDGGAQIVRYRVTGSGGGTCTTTTALSCTVTGLKVGQKYVFSVTADNTTAGRPGTGVGPASSSAYVTVLACPGAPSGLQGVGGDRTLTLSWVEPVSPGTSAISRYEVSLDGGKSWRRVASSRTSGGQLTATLQAVRNGTTYAVKVRAVNYSGPGAASGTTSVPVRQWFFDPLTAAQRAVLMVIPSSPTSYKGAVRNTKAYAASDNGTPAMTFSALAGRQLQAGQAVTMLGEPMFEFNKTTLTARGREQLGTLAQSLRYVSGVQCEGHADYGGPAANATALASNRAKIVCDRLKADAGVSTVSKGFSHNKPAIVGGTSADRAGNRRVVVLVTKDKPIS